MEYVVSFLAFFLIYFGLTYLFSVLKGKFNVKESENMNQKGKAKGKNSNNNRNTKNRNTNQKDNSEFHRILKNSLVISFVYIFIILIMKFFK